MKIALANLPFAGTITGALERLESALDFVPLLGLPTTFDKMPRCWTDPRNSIHEKAAMCRAAENNIFIAAVNYALPASQTTSAVIAPDGSQIAHQPYEQEGILVVDIDPADATGLLAARYRPADHHEIPVLA